MIVKEALRDMQDLVRAMPGRGQTIEHIAEIAHIGLVRPDILGRVDRGEDDPEPRVAAVKAGAVDIRQDDEPVKPLEIEERRYRIGKGGPFADRGAEGTRGGIIGCDAPLGGKAPVHPGEQFGI
jgi:hypothetical protein